MSNVFTIMAVSQLPVGSCLTARRVFKGELLYWINSSFSFSFQWSIICSAKENKEFIYIIQMILHALM